MIHSPLTIFSLPRHLLSFFLFPLCSLVSFVLKMYCSRIIPLLAAYLNRGSIPPPHLPSSFLLFSKTPYMGFWLTSPPFTSCLNIIEPRFEPRARQPQVATLAPRPQGVPKGLGAFPRRLVQCRCQLCQRHESLTIVNRKYPLLFPLCPVVTLCGKRIELLLNRKSSIVNRKSPLLHSPCSKIKP
jgi:hypothetical protein